jgi:ribosomal protein L11 methyltransferase
MLDAVLKQRRPRNVLDVGTGTGVLALAAARYLRAKVAAGDIDPISVEATLSNARLNGATPWIRPVVARGTQHPDLRKGAPYDLIFANILSKPLRMLAPEIARLCDTGGELILSGLLYRDVPGVLSAYTAQGFALKRKLHLEGWATLLMARGGAAHHAAPGASVDAARRLITSSRKAFRSAIAVMDRWRVPATMAFQGAWQRCM